MNMSTHVPGFSFFVGFLHHFVSAKLEYSQMNTHVPEFQSFERVFASFL